MYIKSKLLLIALIVALTATYGCAKGKEKILSKAPDFEVADISNNQIISLKNYKEKVVLLNFWATWCPPCRAEIPDLIQLYEKYKENFVIIGVSLDREGIEVVKDFYSKFKINYPVVMGNPEIVKSYGGISAIPTSFLINKKGEIVQTIVGYRSRDQYESYILPLINEK